LGERCVAIILSNEKLARWQVESRRAIRRRAAWLRFVPSLNLSERARRFTFVGTGVGMLAMGAMIMAGIGV